MKRFLYYLPGLPGANPKMLADRGLLERFVAPGGKLIQHVITGVTNGPEGSGCIVAAGANPAHYTGAESQRWAKGAKFWIGVEELTPRASDLIRPVGISGYEITLADGQDWKVPLIRRWDPERLMHVPNVPTALQPVLENGTYRYVSKVRAEYAAADALAGWVFDAYVNQKTVPMDDVFAKAAALLAINYRIGVEEAGLLGVFDEVSALRVLSACVDLPKINRQAHEASVEGLEIALPRED